MQASSSIDAAAPTHSSSAGPAYRRRTIATNFFAMTAVSGIVLLIGIFATAYSRRVLGPAAIGQVNWNAALLAFLTLLASPGLALVGQRDIAANPKQTASITSLVLGLQMVFGVVAYAVVVAIALLDPRGGQASTLLLIQGVIILINAGSAIWVLQGHQRMAGPAIASLVINVLQIPALLLLIREPGDIYLFAAYTLPFSLALVGYYFWYLQHHGILQLRRRAAAPGRRRQAPVRGLAARAVVAGGAGDLQRRRHPAGLHPQRHRSRPLHHGLQADVHLDRGERRHDERLLPGALAGRRRHACRRGAWRTTSPP